MKRCGEVALAVTMVCSGFAVPAVAQEGRAELFAPGVLQTAERDEYGPVLNRSGDVMYFTIRRDRRGSEYLVVSERRAGAWSEPVALPFSGSGHDKEPYLSQDGRRLFFASTRPVPSGEPLGFELWMVERRGEGWGEPRHLEAVGSPGYENYPAVSADGTLYFGSDRIGGRGKIFRAVWDGEAYGEPEVVIAGGEPMAGADPYVDPEERFIIHSSTRDGGLGEGDLYLTVRDGDGWGPSVHLGTEVNSADYEYTPFVTADGAWLYFSRGWGEMWRIRVEDLEPVRRALGR